MLDGLSVYALAAQCALATPADLTAAVALHESGGEPFSVKINNTLVITESVENSIATVAEAVVEGQFVTFGLGMVSKNHTDAAGIGIKEGFSPCRNLKILGDVLAEHYSDTKGAGKMRWLKAAALYGTGIDVGEVAQAYIGNIEKIRVEFAGMGNQTGLASQSSRAAQSSATPQNGQTGKAVPQPTVKSEAWSVFNNNQGQTVLVYERD